MPANNRLIQSIPPADRTRFVARCEQVDLAIADRLYEAGAPTKHVYFPIDGFVSLVSIVDGESAIEVGMVGREGMLGVHVALGVARAPLRAIVQGEGVALRMSSAKFRVELEAIALLRRSIGRYVSVLMAQLATSATCMRHHEIQPRLARWLLMCQDRARDEPLHMTQEFLSYMLGVRRVGVTGAALALQRAGLIAYHRGDVTVVDRPGLEAAACSCYASDRAAYAMLAP